MLARLPVKEREDALAELKAFIAAGRYKPGDRLPSERELIVRLGLTRMRLRWALDELERKGRIWRHVGKGTFLTDDGKERLAELSRRVTPVQMMRARLALEPALAKEAAINASESALSRIKASLDRTVSAATWAEYETSDDLFHRMIAEATDNVLLLSLFDQLNHVRRAVAWNTVVRNSRCPPANHASFSEHERIASAIKARNPATADSAMRDHLRSVSTRLFGEV